MVRSDVLELDAELLRDELTAGDDGHVLQHRFPTVAKSRRLHGHVGEHAAQAVDHERGEHLSFDIFGDDQQRHATLRDLLEQREEILHVADLAFVEQDERVFEDGLHLLGIGDEIRREIPTIELQALNDFHRRFRPLGFLDGHGALGAHLLDRLRDELADGRIVVRRNRGDLLLLALALDRAGLRAQGIDGCARRAVETALEIDRAGTRRDVADAVRHDRVREQRRGRGPVSHGVTRAFGGPAEHLCAQVLVRVLQREFLGDGDAVVADERLAPLLFDQHTAGSGPSVTRTASAMAAAPRSTFSRASDLNSRCLWGIPDLTLTRTLRLLVVVQTKRHQM